MNTGTRLTLLQSKGLNLYAVKMGTGWELEVVTPDAEPKRRELSVRRVDTMLDGLLAIQTDLAPIANDDLPF